MVYSRLVFAFWFLPAVSAAAFDEPLDWWSLQPLRNEPPKFLVAFNLPDLKLPTGKRDVTNVPAQALKMMNVPLVMELARHWSAQLVSEPHVSASDRITAMFIRAFGREAEEEERNRWITALREFASEDSQEIMTDEAAWRRLAHSLFNAKEFIYYR